MLIALTVILVNVLIQKKWWTYIKTLLSNNGHRSIPPILYVDRVVTKDKDKAEIFNTIFSEKCSLPAVRPNHPLPPFEMRTKV